jgi:centromere protein C
LLIFVGNYYSIVNESEKPARLFFSQGCEVQAEEGEDSQA